MSNMVKKDNLNIDAFMTKSGKNYRRAKLIDKSFVSKYFKGLGFEVLEVEQLWRHIHGKLRKNNKVYFLKMASTE